MCQWVRRAEDLHILGVQLNMEVRIAGIKSMLQNICLFDFVCIVLKFVLIIAWNTNKCVKRENMSHLQLKRGPDIIHCDLEALVPEWIEVSEESEIYPNLSSSHRKHTCRQSCSCTPACFPLCAIWMWFFRLFSDENLQEYAILLILYYYSSCLTMQFLGSCIFLKRKLWTI